MLHTRRIREIRAKQPACRLCRVPSRELRSDATRKEDGRFRGRREIPSAKCGESPPMHPSMERAALRSSRSRMSSSISFLERLCQGKKSRASTIVSKMLQRTEATWKRPDARYASVVRQDKKRVFRSIEIVCRPQGVDIAEGKGRVQTALIARELTDRRIEQIIRFDVLGVAEHGFRITRICPLEDERFPAHTEIWEEDFRDVLFVRWSANCREGICPCSRERFTATSLA